MLNSSFRLRNKISIITLIASLSACSILPGLQNPNTANMRRISLPPIHVESTLIPITPALVQDTKLSRYVYRIAPADVLSITVWQHAEFVSPIPLTAANNVPSVQGAAGQEGHLVNPQGKIYFPLIGEVTVAGKTVDEVRVLMTKRLKKYLRNPELNVRVADFRGRKVYVMGEVMKPGFIPLNDQPLTLTDAIIMTGSFDPNAADPSHLYVIRGHFRAPEVYWLNARTAEAMLLAEYFVLQPGDIVYVSSADATRWNRVINQLLPTLETIWYTKSITRT